MSLSVPVAPPRTYNLWVLVEPAEDLKDQWVAHCLDFDVVSQGNSFAHAMDMVCEAVAMVVTDDLAEGREPLSRRAPDQYWSELYDVITKGHPVTSEQLRRGVDREFIKAVATQMVMKVEFSPNDGCDGDVSPSYTVPLAWEGETTASSQVRA